jgi:cytidine deaminase
VNEDELIALAQQARNKAHAPYSQFYVGAALLTKSSRIFRGANVENASFGLTMCAERVCVGGAIEAGEREFELLAIVTEGDVPTLPCGACRQVLAQFAPKLRIICATTKGQREEYRLGDLLPRAGQGLPSFYVEHV